MDRLAEWSRSFYAEENEGLTQYRDVIQINVYIVRRRYDKGGAMLRGRPVGNDGLRLMRVNM